MGRFVAETRAIRDLILTLFYLIWYYARMQSAFRERQLRALGWSPRTLSFLSWAAVSSRPDAQRELVASLILDAPQ